MMKQGVILDTNFLISHNRSLAEIKNKVVECADILLPQIVIEEIQGQKSRVLEENYNKINDIINQNKKYFKYKANFKIEDAKSLKEKSIKDKLEKFCDNRIIEYNTDLLVDVLERAKYKKAPFINDENSSDKGFKDAILWCSLLKYKDISNYDRLILVTSDAKAFHKRKSDLLDEFKQFTEKEIFIVKNDVEELYNVLGIVEGSGSKRDAVEETLIEKIEIDDVHDFKSILNEAIDKIMYTEYYNEYQDEYFKKQNFTIYTLIMPNNITALLSQLSKYIESHIFFDEVDFTEILRNCGIGCSKENNVPLDALEDIQFIYEQVKSDDKIYNSLIVYLKTRLNELYEISVIPDDDPFADMNDDNYLN